MREFVLGAAINDNDAVSESLLLASLIMGFSTQRACRIIFADRQNLFLEAIRLYGTCQKDK